MPVVWGRASFVASPRADYQTTVSQWTVKSVKSVTLYFTQCMPLLCWPYSACDRNLKDAHSARPWSGITLTSSVQSVSAGMLHSEHSKFEVNMPFEYNWGSRWTCWFAPWRFNLHFTSKGLRKLRTASNWTVQWSLIAHMTCTIMAARNSASLSPGDLVEALVWTW